MRTFTTISATALSAACALALSCGIGSSAFAAESTSIPTETVQAETPTTTSIATWQAGTGLVGTATAQRGTPIALGQTFSSSKTGPIRIHMSTLPDNSNIILGADSEAVFFEKPSSDGTGTRLVCEISKGIAQFDLNGMGPYSGFSAYGASVDVRVTGTLFVVERSTRTADFVALIRGSVEVGLRKEIALALGSSEKDVTLLGPRQGLSSNISSGISAAADIAGRPQLSGAADELVPAEEAEGENWDNDEAGDELLVLAPNETPETPEPETPLVVETEPEAPVLDPTTETDVDITAGGLIGDDLSNEINNETLGGVIDEVGGNTNEITEQIIESTIILDDFPAPPPTTIEQ